MNIIRPDDIRQQRYPMHDDFKQVVGTLRKVIEDNPAFIGGLIAGSVILGEPNPFSDLDGVGLYRKTQESLALEGARHVAQAAALHHVPMNHFRFMRLSEAARGEHTITKSFRAHLEACELEDGAVIKAPILHHFSEHPDSLAQNALDYILHKLQKLRRLLIVDPEPWSEDWVELTEECLQTPFYCALRTLEAITDSAVPVEYSSRRDLVQAFKSLRRQNQLPFEHFERVLLRVNAHREYLLMSDFPRAALGDTTDYEERLQRVAAMSEEVYSAIALLHDRLKPQIYPEWHQFELQLG